MFDSCMIQVQKVMKNKQCQMTEAELQAELENLQIQLEEENKVNKASRDPLTSYLRLTQISPNLKLLNFLDY